MEGQKRGKRSRTGGFGEKEATKRVRKEEVYGEGKEMREVMPKSADTARHKIDVAYSDSECRRGIPVTETRWPVLAMPFHPASSPNRPFPAPDCGTRTPP
eukprot:3272079-Rhodomonas_salina.2